MTTFHIGLDLGQAKDFTALAVLEKSWAEDPEKPDREVSHYAVRHLERLALGTPYTEICVRVAQVLKTSLLDYPTLAVDHTGVGRPVVDMLRNAQLKANLVPITITGGHKAAPDELGGWLVPKKELVSTLQLLFQARRIKIPSTLPAAETLVQEMLNFKVKITLAANETFGAWREGIHDDLVLAVAIAGWEAEMHGPCLYPGKLDLPRRLSLYERMTQGRSNAARRGLFGHRGGAW